MTSESEREQELRRLLAKAVEPVEPAPGAQTRLLARARAQQRRRQRPLMERFRVPAAVVSSLAIVVLAVVFVGRGSDESKGSSAGATAAGAPSRAAEASSAAAAAAGGRALPSALAPVPASPSSKDLSNRKGAATSYSGSDSSASEPQAVRVLSDLDGDGVPDTFTLGAGTLAAHLSRDGLQTVDLPEFGSGARVLGVASLRDAGGKPVPVVFVRLRQVGSTTTDTVVSVVGGSLTVLEQGSGPALLTIDATHGYACDDSALLVTGSSTPYVVYGAGLVASPGLRVALAAAVPAKTTGCVTP